MSILISLATYFGRVEAQCLRGPELTFSKVDRGIYYAKYYEIIKGGGRGDDRNAQYIPLKVDDLLHFLLLFQTQNVSDQA